jgi:hypothetical protein
MKIFNPIAKLKPGEKYLGLKTGGKKAAKIKKQSRVANKKPLNHAANKKKVNR